VRASVFISIASCGVLSVAFWGGQTMHAQAAPTASPSSGTAFQDSANELTVAVGKTVLVDCVRPAKRVAVGLGDVAEASVISPTEIMVNGKTAGETSLIIWDDRGGRQFFNITVRVPASAMETGVDSIRRQLRTELPGQTLNVGAENGVIYLRGTVDDLTSSARAVQIASTAGKVVNLLNVKVPPAKPQILLKVRIASVDRNKLRNMGINLFNLGLGNTLGGISTTQFSPPFITGGSGSSSSGSGASGALGSATMTSEGNFFVYFPGLNAGATITALQTQGVAEVLAEPNLLAMDGKQASFLAGGQYPYPMVQGTSAGGAGAVTIAFKEYGVRLNFIPTVTPRNTIRLQVAPEVSTLDFSNAITMSGFTVPAITTRRINTEVELADSQTFILGGLLDNRETETFEKIPFIGDIPVLGKFFQSKSTNRTNTELLVMVTPELVNPIAAGAPLPELKYPAKFLPPNSNVPMQHPDAKTAENTPAPAPATIPVETLIQSMKPEKPLVIDSATGGFGAASSSGGGGGSTDSSAPQQ
jgi:Flp pilus assembly protein, secretin CpaC